MNQSPTLAAALDMQVEGIDLAYEREVLTFTYNSNSNQNLWTITDPTGRVRQDRALDGGQVILKNGEGVKVRTLGDPSWPVGASIIENYPFVLFVEGGTDFLAAHCLIFALSREKDTAVVCMLGASNRIHLEAVKLFEGKRVRIFPDMDKAGILAAKKWMDTLEEAGAKVDLYDFENLTTDTGEPVNDFRDFLRVHVNDWEADLEVREAIPHV